MEEVDIYTDGACSGNPGPGGWGAILRFRTAQKVYEKELSGGEPNTTNNRMEMTALLEALRQLKEPCAIDLYAEHGERQQGHAHQQEDQRQGDQQDVQRKLVRCLASLGTLNHGDHAVKERLTRLRCDAHDDPV